MVADGCGQEWTAVASGARRSCKWACIMQSACRLCSSGRHCNGGSGTCVRVLLIVHAPRFYHGFYIMESSTLFGSPPSNLACYC